MDNIKRAAKVEMLVFDVDGVLTNNQIIFGSEGEVLKVFHSQDGLGLAAACKAGLKTAVITGRDSEMVRRRCADLNFAEIRQGSMDKVASLREIMNAHQLTLDQIGYVGDDLNDLAVMSQVGFACAVANAVQEVKKAAHYVAAKEGGRGAAREIIEFILKSQGKWQTVVEMYRNAGRIETRQ